MRIKPTVNLAGVQEFYLNKGLANPTASPPPDHTLSSPAGPADLTQSSLLGLL